MRLKKNFLLFASLFMGMSCTIAQNKNNDVHIKVPTGFSNSVVADGVGRARHIAITDKGDLYVKLNRLEGGKGIVYLHDSNGDGIYDQRKSFGDYVGTGIYLKNGYLYASSNDDVYRYKLDANGLVIHPDSPERIVSGLINRRQHESKSIVLDNGGNIYVNIGAYSNSCQEKDRQTGSMGVPGCPLLDSAGGIWKFKADQMNQTYKDGERYATGFRNVVGLDWNQKDNSLYVMQHGRDQLTMFPQYYDEKTSANLPAETFYKVPKGGNGGWPYSYYDQNVKKKIISPEYGGDGKKEYTGTALDPLVGFPAHMAPNGLLFYTGNQFPEKYKNGAFIAFHGSWNRSPELQEGYYVAFVPFKDGKPSGDWEIFADGFAGVEEIKTPGMAKHRPCGLAQGPDGSLYVSDDSKGTIYKISYHK
ncbi:MAG: PQQ-dependent sugar dehydrogenase [Bacteroidetes bacterium]|nr:PQQ-dependent sugar dehydrogenase [Bacteroidota bacterium]MBU1371120.1 PQQ-dependent sugar dehydrogenase [Bacteroidota bacterium]MBU1485999.1 PQQ-dependent sugar dehydrogenase [Bacteroidota bacterium]MBU1760635.1 PQQ-dependent sugar dehydrogenase [Bacteroidota bacterium]MBU2268466.1 PQQ-dependent sugar dehydrogenase [Bacteroidota bacterium]